MARSKDDVPGSLVRVGDLVSVNIEGRDLGEAEVIEVTVGTNKSALLEFKDGRRLRMNQLWLTVIRKSRR